MNDSKARRAKNEALFRDRNEKVLRLSESVLDKSARRSLPLNFLCECSNISCRERVTLTADEYTSLRENSRQFIIKRGHEQPDIERIVHSAHPYKVVEKQIPVPPTSDTAPI